MNPATPFLIVGLSLLGFAASLTTVQLIRNNIPIYTGPQAVQPREVNIRQ